ncbi:ComEA family DNA-binding protein [Sansalvadorimonas verongulae]|uniref:ComEA family DNA-binding protein n=1 Tax=Sansalvadorimonas verongulae TaxID=2172824 RepID=UPI0012BC2F7C|nr:helix-hairpin-helix domain-containing protein [Sansalvadorimonas verongulae]MTI12903.1 helix-hairpin-helix domain-containing protein [Sansalvadorimonas verongulae]
MLKKIVSATFFSFFLVSSPTWADKHDSDKVNINTANAETLDKELKYVGEKTAKRIVDYRDEHGEFKSAEELSEVRGVGMQIIEANKEVIVTE